MIMEWHEMKSEARRLISERGLSDEYTSRLNDEINEIEKQGANSLWVDTFNSGSKCDINPNGLVLPWLLGMTTVDPIVGVNKLYVEDSSGKDMDAICIENNGITMVVSPYTIVKTERGFVRAMDLCESDSLVME
jgi:hypothetical protein